MAYQLAKDPPVQWLIKDMLRFDRRLNIIISLLRRRSETGLSHLLCQCWFETDGTTQSIDSSNDSQAVSGNMPLVMPSGLRSPELTEQGLMTASCAAKYAVDCSLVLAQSTSCKAHSVSLIGSILRHPWCHRTTLFFRSWSLWTWRRSKVWTLSLREIAQQMAQVESSSNSRRFCMCKTQCKTKKCSCKKAKIPCSSLCHPNSKICRNHD